MVRKINGGRSSGLSVNKIRQLVSASLQPEQVDKADAQFVVRRMALPLEEFRDRIANDGPSSAEEEAFMERHAALIAEATERERTV